MTDIRKTEDLNYAATRNPAAGSAIVVLRMNGIHRFLLMVCATALAAAILFSPNAAHADQVSVPPMPTKLQAPAGNKAYLLGHAVGTQNYVCLPTGWTFYGPQATLFDDEMGQMTTHFLSPNPLKNGALFPTWQHSKDTSTVWAKVSQSSSDPAFVEAGAIPWLLLEMVDVQDGTGNRLSGTTYIQRVNTSGGVAPLTGCTLSTDVGKKAMVPYTTDYIFYRDADGSN